MAPAGPCPGPVPPLAATPPRPPAPPPDTPAFASSYTNLHRGLGIAALARHKLQNASRSASNEEDVALSAFASFCQGAQHGHFPDLFDRDNLWRLLVVLTIRKASHLLRYEGQKKRTAGREAAALDQ